jgi:hypothetical protein
MERREALKNIGFGSAALFSSSLLFGALQSCSPQPKVDWVPVLLTPEEAAQLEKICEGICPKTETPGATEAGVANHIDQALSVLNTDKEADYFRRGMAVFVKNFDANQDVKFNKATTEQITAAINEYFKKYDENPDILKRYRSTFNDPGEKNDEFLETHFVTNVVDSTFYSYFTSELVGEEVMPYDPIPVKYEGCLPYEPGQKSWASV